MAHEWWILQLTVDVLGEHIDCHKGGSEGSSLHTPPPGAERGKFIINCYIYLYILTSFTLVVT